MGAPKRPTCPVCGNKPHPDGIRHLTRRKVGAGRTRDRYQARFSAPDGRRRSATFETTQDASAWLSAQHAAVSAGKWREADTFVVVAFRDYAADWLAGRMVNGQPIADRTRATYADLLDRFILPTFGPLSLHSITREAVDRWYERTAKGLPTTKAKAYALLHTILSSAVDDEHLAENPARIKGATKVKRRHQVRPATFAELDALTAAMPPRYRLMVGLATFCALRFGEITELRRGDIEWRAVTPEQTLAVVKVRRAVVNVPGVGFVVKRPKSEAGVRDVTVPPHLSADLAAHLLEHTAPGAAGLMFSGGDGKHLAPSTLYGRAPTATRAGHGFYAARAAAGRDDLRWHDLRHTGSTNAARAGATLADLMGRLGHSTVAASMIYQHTAADRDLAIATGLSAAYDEHRAAQDGP